MIHWIMSAGGGQVRKYLEAVLEPRPRKGGGRIHLRRRETTGPLIGPGIRAKEDESGESVEEPLGSSTPSCTSAPCLEPSSAQKGGHAGQGVEAAGRLKEDVEDVSRGLSEVVQ